MTTFLGLIDALYYVFFIALLIRAVLSWFNARPDNPLVIIIHYITEPILSPLRRITPRVGMIDVTPMLAIILLYLIVLMLNRALG
jgi:YggT family protein